MKTMKRLYQTPETQSHTGTSEQMLASSYITIGGTGSFDVKEDKDWADIWQDESEPQ